MYRKLTLALIAGLVAAIGLTAITGCAKEPAADKPATTSQPEGTAPQAEVPVKPSAPEGMTDVTELKIEDLEVGTGAEAVAGKQVTVHYTGWLIDGTEFDSSLNSGQPFTFALGAGMVIPGWDQGVAGMKVGGTRVLTIPPALGYGESGTGPIPPNATLVFQVELVGVQ